MKTRHFLSLDDLGAEGIRKVIDKAISMKARSPAELHQPLAGRSLGMLFEKASTRTRVSFEAGMTRLGGHAIFLAPEHSQIGRGEAIEDTARVLSRMVDVIMIRNHSQKAQKQFANHSHAPVINGLSDRLHPCQLLADMQTYTEHHGDIANARVAWVGDGNNMCHSWLNAARILGFDLRIATPPDYGPDPTLVEAAGNCVNVCQNKHEAVDGANLVVTDTWASMGDEDRDQRLRDFSDFQVDAALMSQADNNALFMHCLPAYRGEEVAADVIDASDSVVWAEAENRMHAQNALLLHLLQD